MIWLKVIRPDLFDHTPRLSNFLYRDLDFADEWVTKAMMHYRWSYIEDIQKASRIIVSYLDTTMNPLMLTKLGESFAKRQIERLDLVIGSNVTTKSIIEDGYVSLLFALDKIFQQHKFLFGDRPSSADFALYGQLTQLTSFDPTPSRIAAELSPRTCAWVGNADDLSGLSTDTRSWLAPADLTGDGHRDLLHYIGRVYIPLLKENHRAYEAKQMSFHCKLNDGRLWTQNTFNYQSKCWQVILHSFGKLSESDQKLVNNLLGEGNVI